MRYILLSLFLFLTTILISQEAAFEIKDSSAIIDGGQGNINLFTYSQDEEQEQKLMIDAYDFQTYLVDSMEYCGTLYIQDQGGDVYIGSQGNGVIHINSNLIFDAAFQMGDAIQTKASSDIAFGSIKEDGMIHSGSSNLQCSWDPVFKDYTITIPNVSYDYKDFSTLITPTSSTVYSSYTRSKNNKLLVTLRDLNGDKIEGSFSFVTHQHIAVPDNFHDTCFDEEGMVLKKANAGRRAR